MTKAIPLDRLVAMAFRVQQHSHGEDALSLMQEAYRVTLQGYAEVEITKAFIFYIQRNFDMPPPCHLIRMLDDRLDNAFSA